MKLSVGQPAKDFSITDVYGNVVQLKDFKGRKLLLAFQRNTTCPFCNYQLFKLNKIYPDLQAQGLAALVFFESKKEFILKSSFLADQKITIISDPKREIYEQYGAEISPEKAQATLSVAGRMKELQESQALNLASTLVEEGINAAAIPSAFLIDEDSTIQYIHYGNDAGDNIPMEVILAFANQRS
jgi:peroxiredoxin